MGIDPGLRGAIAIYDTTARALLSVEDMPLVAPDPAKSRKKASKTRRQIDPYSLAILIDSYANSTALAVVEDVHAMTYTTANGETRGQGAAASFAFGKSAGLIIGVLASSMIPMAFVRPSVWKALLNLTHDKNLSRIRATELFPDLQSNWQRAKDDGRAEAALLSYFGATRLVK